MFCKVCGTKNDSNNTYCINDGVKLHENNEDIVLSSKSNKFCQECGNSVKSEDIYCSNCGISLFELKEKSKLEFELPKINNIPTNFDGIEDILDNSIKKFDLKKSFLYGIVGSIVVFIISILTSFKANEFISSLLASEFGFPLGIDFLGPLNVFPILNLGTVKLNLSVLDEGLTASASFGLHILSLIPLFIFVFLGIIKGFVEDKESNLLDLGLNSLAYALIAGIFALIGSRKIEVPLGVFDFFDVPPFINLGFSMLSVILNGFILSILGLGIGYGIVNLIKRFELNDLESSISKGFISFGVLMIVVISLNQIGIKSDMIEPVQIEDKINASQTSAYLFGIVNMGKLKATDDFGNVAISVFSDFDEASSYLFTSISKTSVYISIILIVATFFLLGFISKKKDNKYFYAIPIIYALSVSLYMITLKTSLSYTELGEFGESASYGFSFISTLLGSLVLSGISTFSGYLIGGKSNE